MTPTKVIVHCSATPDYPREHKRFDLIGAKEIGLWHKERGFKSIGYHYVIRRSAVIEAGRPDSVIGAHCEGENHDSLGICLVGTASYMPDQINSLCSMFIRIWRSHNIGIDSWYTHNYYNHNKTCPGFDMEHLRNILSTGLT